MVSASLIAVLALAAVAVSREWEVIYPNYGISLGLSFADESVGYTAATRNGAGPVILKSVDGGNSWRPCNVTNWGGALLLMAVDAVEETVIVSSISGELYSDNAGASFHQSIGGGLSQSVRHVGIDGDRGTTFGVAGEFPLRNTNGVAITYNSGRTFSLSDAGLYTPARYGAYPSSDVWYVAAGAWPSDPDEPNRHPLSYKSEIFSADGKVTYLPPAFRASQTPIKATAGSYTAQIAKTVDAGLTWTSVFSENNTFYFNGIDCSPTNTEHCCAVGDGGSNGPNPSLQPGGRIHCTTDGGRTWPRTYWHPENATNTVALFEIRFVGPNEVWACGASIARTQLPMFWHSTDGGQTWVTDTENLQIASIAMAISFPTPSTGYSTFLSSITQSSSIAKYQA